METNSENSNSEQQNKKMNPLVIVGIISLIAVGVVALMPKNNTQDTQTTDDVMIQDEESLQSVASPAVEAADISGVKTINLEAGAFYYSQKEIKVKQGDKVKIVMTSKDMMHDFNIDELNVKSTIAKAGETTTVEFTADKAGTFEYYCSVGQHKANGQVGQLIVE